MKILSIVRITVKKHCGYGYLWEIVVKRTNQKDYVFKEAEFSSLHLNDIEDMFLLYYQNKLYHLDGKIQTDLAVALRDIPLDRIEVLRYDTNGVKVRKGIMQTEIELTLEQTQQGASNEVLSDTKVFTVTMEILSEPTSNKLCGSEIVTHRFTLIVLSDLRRSGNENSKYGEFNTSVLENPKLYARNPVKKVLHKLNLCDHRSILTELEIHTRMVIPHSSRIEVIATCSYPTNICKDTMKSQVHVSKDFSYSDTARLP
ncbi:hypothetical protein Tco_0077150 [Tanacetum coccineum]